MRDTDDEILARVVGIEMLPDHVLRFYLCPVKGTCPDWVQVERGELAHRVLLGDVLLLDPQET